MKGFHMKHAKYTHRIFIKHILRNTFFVILAIALALAIGISGYHYFEDMSVVDAFLNASMILSGMGPVSTLHTTAGKVFAGSYAIFSGLMFILILGLLLSPIIHRIFLKIRLDV